MNSENIEEILNKLSGQNIPPDIANIAEQTSESFTAALRFLRAQPTPRLALGTGFRPIAVAAAVFIVFSIGLTIGRWAIPTSSEQKTLNVPNYQVVALTFSPDRQTKDGFWRQKALAAMKPRPYRQRRTTKTALIDSYKQYLKEKYYD